MESSFWKYLDALVAGSELVIDRPTGSRHPRVFSVIYPLDYGYLAGTSGGDGNEIDVWRGSLPDDRLDAIVCTSDLGKRDTEIKLMIGCTDEEKRIVCRFHESNSMGAMLIRRQDAEAEPTA